MSDEKSQQQTSTESTVAGAAKAGKAISNIAKGAAAGGAHGAAIEAGKSSAKWLIPLIAAVLLPLILVAMLPSIIFGSLLGDGTDSPNGISNDEVLVQNMTAINEGISSILSEGLTDVLERIDSDFASSGCDGKEINNPFGADVVFNANAFVSQYCAHKDTEIASISKKDSTNYEDLYDAEYRYGSRNQIDYDIPEIQYGLSQEFLESSLNNPYLNGNTHYGFGRSSSNTQYPESDFGSSSIISGSGTIEMPYEPSVTLNDLKQSDGSIGQVSIERVGLNCKVYEGATDSSMSKGAGHYSSSDLYTGNVGLFGHNRGNHPYFGKLKNVKVGDSVKYKTAIGTKTYKVTFVGAISYTDFSYLNEMGDNRITLITCIANQPSLRLCVQAVEIR